MKVSHLADACAVIVFLTEPDPARVMSEMADELMRQRTVGVSAVTVWEITRKASIGKLPRNWGIGGLSDRLLRQGFEPVPLTWDDAEQANSLPAIHKDPMDRMLVAQSKRLGIPIITNDGLFSGYGVETVW